MHDVQRNLLSRLVLDRLRDPRFRERLTATDAEGNHPIVSVAVEDEVRLMLEAVMNVGGAANVVVPYLNGLVVMAVHASVGSTTNTTADAALTAHCTVGVLLERLRHDGDGSAYAFVVSDSTAHAELVAVAG